MTCPSCSRENDSRRDRVCRSCRRVHEAKVRIAMILRARFSFGRLAEAAWLVDPDPRAVWPATGYGVGRPA